MNHASKHLRILDASEKRIEAFQFFTTRDMAIFGSVAALLVIVPSVTAHIVTGPVAGLSTFGIMLAAVAFIARRAARTFSHAKAAMRRQCIETCWAFLAEIGDARMAPSRARFNSLLALVKDRPSTPESAAAVRTISRQLTGLVWAYADAARYATEIELKALTEDLLASVHQIGVFADEHRRALLHLFVMDFDANRKFIDTKAAASPLKPL